MNRTAATNLYRKAHALYGKAHHNAGKLQFMSFRGDVGVYETYGDQLKAMFDEANEASQQFARAVLGLSTEEIVSIIEDASATELAGA